MKKLFIYLGLTLLFSCSDSENECLQQRIDQFKMNQSDCSRATITKYNFQNRILYGFADGICISDGGENLIDENCETFCFIGGIAGLTDCEGVNFLANASVLEIIWENN